MVKYIALLLKEYALAALIPALHLMDQGGIRIHSLTGPQYRFKHFILYGDQLSGPCGCPFVSGHNHGHRFSHVPYLVYCDRLLVTNAQVDEKWFRLLSGNYRFNTCELARF
ncbi:hypothetical protein ES707_22575 [subsurface metagenome]